MKEYSGLQKSLSAFIIFILLFCNIGCTSSRMVAIPDLPSYSARYAYIIHGSEINYLLEKNSIISNDTLFGIIKQTYSEKSNNISNRIHIYLSSDTVVNVNSGIYLDLPLREITEADLIELNKATKNTLIGIPLACLGIWIFYLCGINLAESIINVLFPEQ